MDVQKRENPFVYRIIFLAILLAALPILMILVKKSQDIRPHALSGQANLLLNADAQSVSVNGVITVLIVAQLTESGLRLSGADITLLYEKNVLEVIDVAPNIPVNGSPAPFTDAPIVSWADAFDSQYDALRIAEVSDKSNAELPGGTVLLGTVTFHAIGIGTGTIKFPSDHSIMELTGIQL